MSCVCGCRHCHSPRLHHMGLVGQGRVVAPSYVAGVGLVRGVDFRLVVRAGLAGSPACGPAAVSCAAPCPAGAETGCGQTETNQSGKC